MKNYILLGLLYFATVLPAQTVFTTNPEYPTQTDQITITFDVTNATHSNKIAGYTGQVYAHTGVTLVTNNDAPQKWQKVIGSWGNNTQQPQVTRTGTNQYQIVINNPRAYYGVSNSNQKITELSFVLRSADGSKQTEDIFIPLYSAGIKVVLSSPYLSVNYGDPLRSPIFISSGGTLPIAATTSELGTKTKSITLYVNGNQKAQTETRNLSYTFAANENLQWKNEIKIIAADTSNVKDSTVFVIINNKTVNELPLPEGNQIGINYGSDPTKVTLALYAPKKNFIYVIGDFNDWKVDSSYFMNRYTIKADSVIWWLTIPVLSPGKEYAYQFLIDGSIRIQDPYTEKALDPWNDGEISAAIADQYPSGKTEGMVSTLQTAQLEYNWKINNFVKPEKEKLIIYELLIRDFVSTHSYKTLIDTLSYFKRLGVNAIELMPINEFEGNSSWGYNTMMYFAPDKYYGTKNDLKDFIDACHQNGIAVILDMVFNHSFGLSPMVRMYADSTTGYPGADNPWFNPDYDLKYSGYQARHPYSVGYDFNHGSPATKYFIDRVTSFWLTEYKVDGFRFDLTKGLTQKSSYTGNGNYSDAQVSAYDASRIAILKRMANKIWEVSPNAYVILEHFCDNSEETELAANGMMLWGNLNSNYNEATMGYFDNNKSDLSWIYYKKRGWSSPNIVGYMESHDEERLMYKNLTYGNSSGSYSVKNLSAALNRMKLAGAFFFTIPGPKMIWEFGELGYDYSINYPSGTSNDRLTPKPIKWDYYKIPERLKLMKVWSALINLKENYPVFTRGDFSLSVSNAYKRIWISDSSMNVTILGNFDVNPVSLIPQFQNTGIWYDYFSGERTEVTDVSAAINLAPGEFKIYTTVKLPTPEAGITNDVAESTVTPAEFVLNQNYPNPFNPSTTISYNLPVSGLVKLKVFDILGKEVATLVNEEQNAGSHNYTFSIDNYKLSSGVYFYQLKATPITGQKNSFIITKKMILMK